MKQSSCAVMLIGLCSTLAWADGSSNSGWLGISMGPVPDSLRSQLSQLKDDEGVIVLQVMKDTPAEKAGLKKHDIITRIDGESIEGVEGFVETIQSSSPDDKIVLDVVREGKSISIEAILGQRPAEQDIVISPNAMAFQFAPMMDEGEWEAWEQEMEAWADQMKDHANQFSFHFGTPGNDDLSEKIQEMIGEDTGSINVEVNCDNGKGTITVTKNGQTQTESYDCSDQQAGSKHRHMMRVRPHVMVAPMPPMPSAPVIQPMSPSAPRQVFGWRSSENGTRFKVENGKIEVTTNKNGDELTQVFDSEADMEKKNPELYQRYKDMTDGESE